MPPGRRGPGKGEQARDDFLLGPVAAEWDGAVQAWSLLSPDFPEVASVATSRDELWQQADDAIRTATKVRREDGEAVPPPMAEPWLLTADSQPGSRNLLLHVAIPASPPAPEPVRVNVSLDKALLARIDGEAGRRGMTRSGSWPSGRRRC